MTKSISQKPVLPEYVENPRKVNEFHRIVRVFLSRKVVIFGLVVILLLIITAIFAPWLAPYNPDALNMKEDLRPSSWNHLLGTDALGRDTLSRIIYGTRTSLMVGIVSVSIAASIGMTLGLLSGYFGGIISMVILRFIDALMSFPVILLAMVIAVAFGGGLTNVMIAIGISMMSIYTRLMHGQVLIIKQNEYILAARSLGANDLRIILVHLLPNCFPPLIVLITMQMGSAILAEAGLSFLGIGLEPGVAAWGAMVNDGYKYMFKLPVLSFAPGFAIMLVVFAFNMIGDGLRDALDPKLRGTF
jgi:peptide/nickel transport system permease protein